MEQDIKQLIGEVIEHVDQKAVETQRHFDVVAENLDNKFQLLIEQVAGNTEKLFEHDKRFDIIDQRLEGLEVKMVNVEGKVDNLEGKVDNLENKFDNLEGKVDNLEKDTKIIKTDVGFIKAELYQKVPRDEFTFLESRVANLENKK